MDLALNSLQVLICHKTLPKNKKNHPKHCVFPFFYLFNKSIKEQLVTWNTLCVLSISLLYYAENVEFIDSLSLSLTIHPYHQLLLAGLLCCILCPYKADKVNLCLSANTGTSMCRVYKKRWLICLFLLLQQYLAWFIYLTWIVCEMGSRWPYSCCFIGCCFLDLFKTAPCIRVLFPLNIFFMRFVSLNVVHPYSSMTQLQLRRNSILFYGIGQTPIWSVAWQ